MLKKKQERGGNTIITECFNTPCKDILSICAAGKIAETHAKE